MKTIAEIRAACAEAGCHFFERDTMRFFRSRVESKHAVQTYRDDGEAYRFITSEQFDDNSPRLFSVREVKLTPKHEHRTIGEFQAYSTHNAAREALLKGWAS